jgi:hypothetical protein
MRAQVRQRHLNVLPCLPGHGKCFFTFFIVAVAGSEDGSLFQFHVAHFDISLF